MAQIQEMDADIQKLRSMGTKDALRMADDLEIRKVILKHKVDRIENLTLERLQAWVEKILFDVDFAKKRRDDIGSWPQDLRTEMFEALEVAWAANRFRVREAAETLGISVRMCRQWLESEEYQDWQVDKGKYSRQAATLISLTMQRMGSILSLDTNDPDVMKVQIAAGKAIMTSGVTIPERVPGRHGQRPAGHQPATGQQGDQRRPKPMPVIAPTKDDT